MKAIRLFLAALAFALLPAAARGHQLGVETVILEELDSHYYRLRFNASNDATEALGLPILPDRCQYDEDSQGAPSGSTGLRFSSGDRPLGAEDTILLPWRRNGVLVTAVWRNGLQARQFFLSGDGGIRISLGALQAGTGSLAAVARRFGLLGIDHILKGFDHLLFVAGLLLLVRGKRVLLMTVSAFTLAHTLTLALSVVGAVRLPSGSVDAIIALSVVFIAVENVYARRGKTGLSGRYPWLVSFGFGLVHGLGFAGALNALGIPAREVPPALLCFNLGVEVGQLIFIGAWLATAAALRQLQMPLSPRLTLVSCYLLGVVSTCWFLERTLAML